MQQHGYSRHWHLEHERAALAAGVPPSCTPLTRCHNAPSARPVNAAQVLRLHGASITPLLRKKSVTHVIASNLCWSKMARAREWAKGPVHVLPQWVVDSVRRGRRLPEREYAVVEGGGSVRDSLCK